MAVRLNTNIIVFGDEYRGMKTANRTTYYSMRVIWSYNLDIDKWIKFVLPETQDVPEPTTDACAVVVGSEIYIHGGGRFGDVRKFLAGCMWKLSRMRTTAERITWTSPLGEKVSMLTHIYTHAKSGGRLK